MKQCPRCTKTYDDDQLNFCLEDGELLQFSRASAQYAEPPTVLLDQSRVTNPTDWPAAPLMSQADPRGVGQYGTPYPMKRDQTMATVSLCCGIASVTIGWCCSTGLLLSPAALITGFLALSYIKKDPERYGGRGLALGGIVTGVIYFCLLILFVIVYGAFSLFNGLSQIH
jgi:hypothetical protein